MKTSTKEISDAELFAEPTGLDFSKNFTVEYFKEDSEESLHKLVYDKDTSTLTEYISIPSENVIIEHVLTDEDISYNESGFLMNKYNFKIYEELKKSKLS